MAELLTKVVINSVTVHDDSSTESYLINWEYERHSGNVISQLDMKLLDSVDDIVTIVPGQSIEVWSGFSTSTDTKTFSGFIEEANPEGGLVSLSCKDKMWNLIRRNVNTVYESSGPQAGVISAIAEDLIETHGGLTADVTSTGTLDTQKVDEFRCDNTDIWERLVALATAVDYQIWYDAVNDTVHFEPKGLTDSGLTLTVGIEILGMPSWKNDSSRMVNDLRVDGAVSETQLRLPIGTGYGTVATTANFEIGGITLDKTPENVELILDASTPPITVKIGGTKDSTSGHYYYVDRENKIVKPAEGSSFPIQNAIVNYTWLAPSPIHQIDQNSIDTYGLFEKQVTLTDIQTIADAEARTQEILSSLSTPFLVGDLLVLSDSSMTMQIGDRVSIIDEVSIPNISQELVITKQTVKYPGANQELLVGDESLRLQDWQINVESRLKRIEEQLSLKNQDLILELRDFDLSVTHQPRYRKVETQAYNVASEVMIWDHPTYGTWDSFKWGEHDDAFDAAEDHFVEQYNDEYEELFIDADFKSTNTTATWSTTGSVTFTSSQVAESLSIDYDNGTITAATLIATEDSGSFDYEMTADDTNWEAVTSGAAHTFANPGTDLRWRATENAASTGEISKMEVVDYH